MEKIRIAQANRGAGTAPVFAAIEGGYFHANGLAPELVPFPGHPRALQAMIAGQAEFTNTVAVELMLANHAHGGDATIIASALSRSAQQISARPGITTRAQLRGKRFGVVARNDADECIIATVFERWGWDIRHDAEIVVVGSGGPKLDRLLNPARVDVAIMHAPDPFQAAKRGWLVVEDLARLDFAYQNSCAATTRRMLRARPETVRRYVRAYCQGVWRFRTDAAFGIEVLRKYTGDPDLDVLRDSWLLFARLMGGMMYPSPEGIATTARALHGLGALPQPPTVDEVADFEPVAVLEVDGFFAGMMGAGQDLPFAKR